MKDWKKKEIPNGITKNGSNTVEDISETENVIIENIRK